MIRSSNPKRRGRQIAHRRTGRPQYHHSVPQMKADCVPCRTWNQDDWASLAWPSLNPTIARSFGPQNLLKNPTAVSSCRCKARYRIRLVKCNYGRHHGGFSTRCMYVRSCVYAGNYMCVCMVCVYVYMHLYICMYIYVSMNQQILVRIFTLNACNIYKIWKINK